MVPSRGAGGLAHSPSSGFFFQEDVGNSHLKSSFGNSSNSTPGSSRPNVGSVSGNVSNTVYNMASSGPGAGASSLVTDVNSGLSGGPQVQRSASFNTESYMRLPASPISFSSNNISISGSSVMDGSSLVQPCSNQDLNAQQKRQRVSSVTSLTTPRIGQHSLPAGPRVPGSFVQEPNMMFQVQKKPRLDLKHEDLLQQQVFQELLHRKDSMQLANQNPQLQAFLKQQRIRQQQEELLQSMPPAQRAQLLHLQQSGQPISAIKRPNDGGVCSRRLMQYLYHQRQRPSDNPIAYWRKFVSEYFSPRAKKRWCVSLYENVGQHSPGVFPQATMDAWHCDICGSKSGRGFETTFEMLPRLYEIEFGSGVIDELLFLDMPREFRFPTGIMMLEYPKAVQESVYDQLRVVREGQLRVVFAPDLKILSWQFCARRHEELLPRRLVAPQVNQLLLVAQKCQNTIADSGPNGVSQEDLQANSNMIVTAGRQLARTLELPQLNDLGFSKRYVRCLQISEVVSSMKDLMDFCRDRNVGPVEGLKSYPRHSTAVNLQMQKMQEIEQLATIQGLPTDHNTLNKLMALSNNNHHMFGRGASSGSPQSAVTVSNYQNMLTRQNSINSKSNSLQQEASTSYINHSLNPSSTFQGLNQQQQHQQLPLNGNGLHLSQQQMVDQLLQGMKNNTGNASGGVAKDGTGFGSSGSAENSASPNGAGSVVCAAPCGSNSSKSASDHESSAAGGNSGSHQKPPYSTQNSHLSDEMVRDIAHDLTENGFFNGDIEDYDWKA